MSAGTRPAATTLRFRARPAGHVLEARGLSRAFGGRTVVEDVSFRVEPGRMTGFVGANGAGKTTTMRMLTGVLRTTAGEVLWDGRPVTAADRAGFGYMPEERGLYPRQPVLDQLCYLGRLHGMDRRAALAEARRLLERLDLAGRERDPLGTLSLGNQQRVQIAAALLHGPTALVLDEPFSGLDPVAVDAMTGLLRERLEQGVPVLFSSHQLDLVDRLCDSLVVLSAGRVLAAGAVEDLRRAGPRRHRLRCEQDAGWVRGLRGVRAVDVDGPDAVLELDDDDARRRLLRAAVERGLVEFAEIVPGLADVYREVTR
ncbi:ABC transporter ATP-binding protein [Kocuria flava]|uniref:ABC transporter ATP-binding protein n=1 Tax=Kocuria flava TaxID=446860 RepID=A0ABQ0X4L1_9MICC|nr:ATP-binding cassette domain-containing protein [Kocuria flava]MCJ8505464.1 ATP-binding cassette domain-containing protein [Kocuria flava]GEO92586.1 ABC transporter ATP-binding protein [Kocuria flava]